MLSSRFKNTLLLACCLLNPLLVATTHAEAAILPAAGNERNPAFSGAGRQDDDMARILRAAARERQRRVILNNDGCDILYFPENLEPTRENFLSLRTTFLAGRCDTLMYCPISAGQGNFTLPLPGADFLTANPPRKGFRNIAAILAERGDDYFLWLLDFCRRNGMELFFSFRFNDVHDRKHSPKTPTPFFCKFKDEHREFLFGRDHTQSPPNGWWSSLDFSHEAVRERQLRLVNAVLEKYDVDGIDLDFSRYPRIFPRTACGEPASRREVQMMTQLIRDIRRLLDAVGQKKGRGLLLSVVLPDSPSMCLNLGYDVENWFKEGLVDIWQQTDAFQVSSIRANAEFAHRHGVKYYAFCGSPYPFAKLENGSLLKRTAPPAYAARYLNAKAGGADGIYLYNVSNSSHFSLATAPVEHDAHLQYFVTPFCWEIPRGYAFSQKDFRDFAQLSAHVKATITPGHSRECPMEVNTIPPAGSLCTAFIDRTAGPAGVLSLSLNGTLLRRRANHGRYESFDVPASLLHQGVNHFEAVLPPKEGGAWKPLFSTPSGKSIGSLHHDFASREFTAVRAAFTADVGTNSLYARMSNGGSALLLEMKPGEISLFGTSFRLSLDSLRPHTFEMTLDNTGVALAVDGNEVFRTQTPPSSYSPESRRNISPKRRLYASSTSLDLGEMPGALQDSPAFRNVLISIPEDSVEIANLMLDVLPVHPVREPASGIWRNALGLTGRRALDGRALPFSTASGKQALMAEISLKSSGRHTVWLFSDATRVAAWVITDEEVAVWPGTAGTIILAGDEADTYRAEFSGKEAFLSRNGQRILTMGAVPVEDFLKLHGRRFTKAEQQMIRGGGTLARGLRESKVMPDAELLSLRLLESDRK